MPNCFIVDVSSTELSAQEAILIKNPLIGGIILFSRNFINPLQLKKLIASIHAIRPDIFLAVDHEGGIVQRFQRFGIRSLPAARVFGDVYHLNATVALELAKRYGEIMAADLLALGIDISFAPVLDLHDCSAVIGKLDRAFHQDPHAVASLADAFIQGMHQAGMPATGKHFPGHGSVISDSHLFLPESDLNKTQLFEKDLKPFMQIIAKKSLDAVMPAHVLYPKIDPDWPAGYSELFLKNILRDELHFEGLVISDCLGMTGADIGSMEQRTLQALHAGCDMLIVANQEQSTLRRLLESFVFVQSADSLQRIEIFKSKMARFSKEKTKNSRFFEAAYSNISIDPSPPIVTKTDSLNQSTSV